MLFIRILSATSLLAAASLALPQGPLGIIQHASGFTQPLAVIQDPLDSSTRFVVQKDGLVMKVTNGVTTNTFLDLSGSISYTPTNERGLLGLAFAPNHTSSGHLYAYFTDPSGNIQVSRFTRSGDSVNTATRLDVINIAHPGNTNHNGATPMFGPDGFLYLGIGDGGGANDVPNNAQNPSSLLGKMLRIDPSVDDFPVDPARNYGIPTDNPFFGSGGPVDALDEIWSFGLRNPYKFSFDRANGAMIIADVGQDAWEEINYEPAGEGGRNYGWRVREGAHATGFTGEAYTPLTDPVFEYSHNISDPINGESITGGVVYRGTKLVDYQGRYFFADFVAGRIWSIEMVVDPVTGEATAANLLEHTDEFGGSGLIGNISSIHEGADGELYFSSFNGNVYQVVPEPGTVAAVCLGLALLAKKRRRKA